MSVRILLVEDETELADFKLRGLREEGFAVEGATDGERAWEALQSGAYDLVVFDWWLPGEDGLAVLTRFRRPGGVAPVLSLAARDAFGQAQSDGSASHAFPPPLETPLSGRRMARGPRPIEPDGLGSARTLGSSRASSGRR